MNTLLIQDLWYIICEISLCINENLEFALRNTELSGI